MFFIAFFLKMKLKKHENHIVGHIHLHATEIIGIPYAVAKKYKKRVKKKPKVKTLESDVNSLIPITKTIPSVCCKAIVQGIHLLT